MNAVQRLNGSRLINVIGFTCFMIGLRYSLVPHENATTCSNVVINDPIRKWIGEIGISVNKDARLSIASVSIPYGQRFISVDLEQQSNLLFTAPGNLFIRTTVEQTVSAGTGKGTNAALDVTSCRTWRTQEPVSATGSVIDSTQAISTMQLYINNLFMNPEINNGFKKCVENGMLVAAAA